MKTKNFKFKSMALVLFALVLSSNVWGAIADGTYVLCTSTSDLKAGDHYIIANGTSGDVYCISNVSNTNNRKTVSATVTDSKITVASDATIMTLTLGGTSGAWTFYTDNYAGTNGYFDQGNQTSSNYLKINSSGTAIHFTITFDPTEKNAIITNTEKSSRNLLRYNYNSGTPIFACYTSGQSPVYLYKKAAAKTISSIAVTTQPTKKNYTTCETLDLSGCVVTATYSDESTENVTSSCTFNPANGAALTKGVTSVAVSYSGKNTTITEISVTDGAKDTFVDNVQGTADQYGECNGYTIPSCGDKTKSTGCEGEHYKFIGWSDKRIQSGVEIEPAGLLKAGETHDADDTTYYAVWAKEDEE